MKKVNLLMAFLCLLLAFSCQKSDLSPIHIKQSPVVEKFLQLPENAPPELVQLIAFLREKDEEHPFLENLAKEQGYPVWDKVPIIRSKNDALWSSANISKEEATKPADAKIFIPLVKEGKKGVHAALYVESYGSKYRGRLFKNGDYKKHPFKSAQQLTARQVVNLFLYLENKVYNRSYFTLLDSRLYNNQAEARISIKPRQSFQTAGLSVNITVETCTIYDEYYWVEENGVRTETFTGNSFEICTTTILFFPDSGGSGSGSSDWYTSDPGGGGNGGTGAGTPDGSGDSPCDPDGPLAPDQCCDCGNGYISPEYNSQTTEVANRLTTAMSLNPDQTDWLSTHPTEAEELEHIISEAGSTQESKDAAVLVINIGMQASFHSPLAGHFWPILSHVTAPSGLDPATIYLMTEFAITKQMHPDWSNLRISYHVVKEFIHLGFDVAGMIPVGGECFDLANGVIYILEGEKVQAVTSFAAAIPLVGWFATTAKWAKRTLKLADGGETSLKWIKTVDGKIEFGSRRQLRRVINLAKGDLRQAHHILPWEHRFHEIVQEAAKVKDPHKVFHLNEPINGIALDKSIHVENVSQHPVYNLKVENELELILKRYGGDVPSPEICRRELEGLIDRIRASINQNPGVNLDRLTF